MPDEIYHVEVKKKFRGSDGKDEFRWVVPPATDVIADQPPGIPVQRLQWESDATRQECSKRTRASRGAYVKTGFRVLPFWNVLSTKPRTYTKTVAQPN